MLRCALPTVALAFQVPLALPPPALSGWNLCSIFWHFNLWHYLEEICAEYLDTSDFHLRHYLDCPCTPLSELDVSWKLLPHVLPDAPDVLSVSTPLSRTDSCSSLCNCNNKRYKITQNLEKKTLLTLMPLFPPWPPCSPNHCKAPGTLTLNLVFNGQFWC